MNAATSQREHLHSISASLTFLVNTGKKPVIYPSEGGGRDEKRTGQSVDCNVTIENGWAQTEGFSLNIQGFQLMSHISQVQSFYNPIEVEEIYNRELEDLLKDITGASRVVIFDHTLRADSKSVREKRKIREPSGTVHNDYTEASATQRVRDLFSSSESQCLLNKRFAIINAWRSINGPVETAPLTVCDARSLAPKDLITTERRGRDRIGETYRIAYNPKQRWLYFPSMRPEEVLLIKCWDSDENVGARFSAHTSFQDSRSPVHAKPRESIESRAFAFFA